MTRGRWVVVLLMVLAGPVHAATATLFLNNATTERVVVQHDIELNPIHEVTIEAWLRRSNVADCQTIVGKGFQSAWWLGICSGRLRYYSNGIGSSIDGSATVPADEWTHVAVTFDGTTRRYYINGELDLEQVTPGPLGSSMRAMGIGGEGSSPTFPSEVYPYSGYISEVRIWNQARTQEEIRLFMYRQIIEEQTGLVGVWSLEDSPDDRFGDFMSVLSPGASFSSLDSPPIPHVPLEIGAVASIVADGSCSDAGYTTARSLPHWYEPGDLPIGESNPREVLLGANATYLYVCLPERTQLTDPIYGVEIDTDNHGTNLLENDDYRFTYWPGDEGLATRRGSNVPVGEVQVSTWGSPVANPSGLFAAETPGAEFVTDFEMRIPRSIFTDSTGVFRLRVWHNYLWNGVDDRTVEWPFGSNLLLPFDWQEAQVNLALVGVADSRNPSASVYVYDSTVESGEDASFFVEAVDDVDVVLLEFLVDDVVVQSQEFSDLADEYVSMDVAMSFPTGPHTARARVFDHVGRDVFSRLYFFRVLVDGNPPGVSLSSTPHDPAPGQTVTLEATATDPSGVKTIMIRDVLGTMFPSFERCDFGGAGTSETCTWMVTPSPLVRRLRVDALATDSEEFTDETPDRIILFGNTGPDTDDDGLADTIEAGLCTDPTEPDTDFDGLSDSWEVEGIRFTGGAIEPLTDYGVNPCWKNALLQLDNEVGATPPASGVQNLRNRYRDHDIAVYIEQHERPRPTAYPQSHISANTAVYQGDTEYWFSPQRTWAFYYGYERNLPGRSGAWNRTFTVDHATGSSGFCFGGDRAGEGCRGDFECGGGGTCGAGCAAGTNMAMSCSDMSDCPIDDGSFAACRAPCVTAPGAAGTRCRTIGDLNYRLFHEFGHTVGLGHGGRVGTRAATANGGFVQLDNDWDSTNYKPQQRSVMNYRYSQSVICMEPIPKPLPEDYGHAFVGLVSYLDEDFPALNENALSESPAPLITQLQGADCSHASGTAIPVIQFTCENAGTKYENITDGTDLLAQRAEGEPWNYEPTGPTGIDWDCDGVIEGSVASNINGPSLFAADGFFDGGAWILENPLNANDEFSNIPNPVDCQIMYRANCETRSESCYLWPMSYRLGIPQLDTGVNPVDCRDVFLASRSGDCGGGSDADFGTGTCPLLDPDTPLAATLDETALDGFDAFAARGVELPDTTQEQLDNELTPELPGVEFCDMEDNDLDGEVDEGCQDTDADGVPDAVDNCETIANPDQADRDRDGLGEVCQFPGISNLQAFWQGGPNVTFVWDSDGVPRKGVVAYRYTGANPDAEYRGSGYPSTDQNFFEDIIAKGNVYFYSFQVLNLNGEEGDPVMVEVNTGGEELDFEDGFESP